MVERIKAAITRKLIGKHMPAVTKTCNSRETFGSDVFCAFRAVSIQRGPRAKVTQAKPDIKYKRLKRGGYQANGNSNDYTAVVVWAT
jgi:hypothetical protein